MTAFPPVAPMLATLERFRRRAWLTTARRYAVLTCGMAGGCVALSVFVGAITPEATTVALSVGGGAACAVAVASGIAWLRRPTLACVARTVDSRLHLQNRLSSALQFQDHDDPFAQRVVQDAMFHASAVRTRDAYPSDIPTRLWLAGGACTLVPLVAMLSLAPRDRTMWRLAASTSRMSEATATNSLAQPSVVEAGRVSATASPNGQPSLAKSLPRPQTPRAPDDPRGQDPGIPETPARQDTPDSLASKRPGAADATAERGKAPIAATTGSASAGFAGFGRSGDGPATGSIPGAGGGGTGQGTLGLSPKTARPATRTLTSARWDSAEQALAREQIPPRRRASVRRYFIGIRPSERQ